MPDLAFRNLRLRRLGAMTPGNAILRPNAMAAPSFTGIGQNSVTVVRAAAPADNGSPIIRYDLRYRIFGAAIWVEVLDIAASQPVFGLSAATDYEMTTAAVNAGGRADWGTSGFVRTATATVGLKAQVEALDLPGAVGPRIALTPIASGAPAGTTLTTNKWTISTPGVYSGYDIDRAVSITVSGVTLRDCRVADQGTLGSANYPIEFGAGVSAPLVEYCDLRGSGLPRRVDNPTQNGPGATVSMTNTTSGAIVRRCRIDNFPSDGFKVLGTGTIVEQCVIGPARSVPDYPAYNGANAYALNDWVIYSGRPYRAKSAVPAGNAPSGASGDTPYWDAPAPHTDYITVVSGSGAKVRNCLFKATAGAFLGATQYIRVVRNTGAATVLENAEIYGNVFRPWPGGYPLAAGYCRDIADKTNYSAGEIAIQNGRIYEALLNTTGSAQYPEALPSSWQEIVDPHAGPVIFAHNWLARGTSAVFFPYDAHNGQIEWGPNFYEDDNTAAPARDGMSVFPTLAEPAFGGALGHSFPAVQYTGSDVSITPTGYGKYRVGGADIDACVIRAGARVYCYITPAGVATVPAGVPATVETIGPTHVLRLRDRSGNPISGPISVAAGSATVAAYVAPPSVVSAIWFGQSEIDYLNLIGGAYSGLTPKPVVPATPNLVVFRQTTTGTAPVRTVVTQANINAELVNPAMGAVSAFLKFVRPNVNFVVGDGSVPGTGRPSLFDDSTDGTDSRLWSDFTSVIAAVEGEAGAVHNLIECWYNADAGSINNFRNAFWPQYFGTDGTGATFTLGTTHNGARVDHCLWDSTAAANVKGRGAFRRDQTAWHVLTPMPFHNAPSDVELTNFSANGARLTEPSRQVMHELASNAQAQSVSIDVGPSAHVCKFGGASTTIHPDTSDKDGQVLLAWPFALAMLRASGMTIGEPVISGIEGAADGTYADLVVDLPNGGNLTTLRTLRGGPAYAGTAPHRQAVTGLELTRSGGARRPVYRTTETSYPATHRGTVAIVDSGSGSPRRGRVRVTPTTPFAFGDGLSYLRGQATAVLLEPRDFNLYPDFLIEHVPGFYDSTATYPFEGIAVRPYQSDLAAPVLPPAFTPRGARFAGATGYRSTAMTGIPATSQGMVSMWYRNTNATWDATTNCLFHFRVGANVRLEAKTSTSGRITVTLVNDTGSNNVVCYAGAGTLQHAVNTWYHLLVGWTATGISVWINGVLVGTRSFASVTMAGNNLTQIGIGTTSTGGQYWIGDLAHLYLTVSQYLDFSVLANREKFALSGQPVNLGATGALPTGLSPEWYYDGEAPAWSNQGTAGNVTLTGGPLTVSPVAPSY